jgi:hypothetical protein
MSETEELVSLVEDLDARNSVDFDWKTVFELPGFVTAYDGQLRYFTKNAEDKLINLCKSMHSNRKDKLEIEIKEFTSVVRQVIADMHAAGEFGAQGQTIDIQKRRMKEMVEERIALASKELTHYFPAWTAGLERDEPLNIGPVQILTRSHWIDSVDFPEAAKQTAFNTPEANFRWREFLRESLKNAEHSSQLEGFAKYIYDAVKDCPSLLRVTIRGYERNFSRKLAKIACKSALDAISLCLSGDARFFQIQAQREERLPPFVSHTLTASDGYLWLPGFSFSDRINDLSEEQLGRARLNLNVLLPALSSILTGLVSPSSHSHPLLANRWLTALDWFGEGNRESNDAIAVAKLSTCLDVLSCGGKSSGIAKTVSNLLRISEDTVITSQPSSMTLRTVVGNIYENGRSQILHGNHVNRLKSFEIERQLAANLARAALLEGACRLEKYSGADESKAFRTMSFLV